MLLSITDEFLEELMKCPKKVTIPPSKLKENKGHLKSDFKLSSLDDKYIFDGFIRQNRIFPENFSIGLNYNPKWEKGSFCLLRLNGSHGKTQVHPHHITPHLHLASADIINAGLKSESRIEETKEYITLLEALLFFTKYANIQEEDSKLFDLIEQPGLF